MASVQSRLQQIYAREELGGQEAVGAVLTHAATSRRPRLWSLRVDPIGTACPYASRSGTHNPDITQEFITDVFMDAGIFLID